MDYRLALMAGIDIPIPECQLTLHQPTIKEIAYIGEKDFFIGLQCLCIQKEMVIQDENILSSISNFQIFMTIMNEKQTVDKKIAVQQVLSMLFPKMNALMTPRSLTFIQEKNTVTVDETNFESLQKVLSNVFCLQNSDASSFNPANSAAKRIADKLMKARRRVAELKSQEQGEGSAFAQHISSLVIGVHSMSLEDCLNLTIYQLYDLIERYSLYINWDIDLRSRLAGATPDKPVENWMKQIH